MSAQEEPGVSLNQVNGDPEKENKDVPETKKREYKEFGHENDGPTSMCLYLLRFRRH
jgi:hypothetical protein